AGKIDRPEEYNTLSICGRVESLGFQKSRCRTKVVPERLAHQVDFVAFFQLDDICKGSIRIVRVNADEPSRRGFLDRNGEQYFLPTNSFPEVRRETEGCWGEWIGRRRRGSTAGGLIGVRSSRTRCLVPDGDRVGRLAACCRCDFSLRRIS